MSEAIIQSQDCCTPCFEPRITQVVGPQGPRGVNGENGHDGRNPYTATALDFVMPAFSEDVDILVSSSSMATVGQVVFVENAGYMLVIARPSAFDLTVQNLADGTLYTANAAPTTVIPGGSVVTAGGYQGLQGIPGSSSLNPIAPTTTKGDLMVDNGASHPNANVVRLAVGADKTVLHADSGQATGLRSGNIDLAGTNTGLTGALGIANGGSSQTTRQAALDALMPPTPAQGDVVRYDGSSWSRLPKGTALQVLRTNSGATDIEWGRYPGAALQMVATSSNAYATTTSEIAYDNTIPQNTEGTQILSVSITPIISTSRLSIFALVPIASSVASGAQINVTVALFNGNAGAINANTVLLQNTAGVTKAVNDKCIIQHVYFPASTSPVTISVRIGNDDGASTIELNGSGGARTFGGVQSSRLIVTEYA